MADEEASKLVYGEVAPARDSDEFLHLWAGGIREPNDPLLRGRGRDLDFYDQVREDAQVWSTLQQRRDAVASRDWEVTPGDDRPMSKEAAKQLEKELRAIDFDAKVRRMTWGVFYGYAVAEAIWAAGDGKRISIGDIRVRRARRFGFDIDGQLMLRRSFNRAEEVMPSGKFWVMSSGCDTDDEPYGFGLAHLLYWPAYFKRNGLVAWMVALDKFGSPTVKGTYPRDASKEEQEKLLAGLRAIKKDSAFIVPEGMEADYLQAGKSASADFEKFDRRLDAWISKIVLSQTMTTDDGSSKAQGEVHMDVRDEVARSDADLIDGSFTECIADPWRIWNYGDAAATPILCHQMDSPEDQDKAAARDERLGRLGYVPDEKRVLDVYGEGYEKREPIPTAGLVQMGGDSEAPALSDPKDDDALAGFVDRLMADGTTRGAAIDMLSPIVEALDGATSLADVGVALEPLEGGETGVAGMQEALSRAMFAARIGGEAGVPLRDDIEQETL